jgi:hypothetical protein
MKLNRKILAFLLTVIVTSSSSAQTDCTLESYYANPEIFREYETLEEVMIDGKKFRIEILSDNLNEYMEPYPIAEYDYDDYAPKTIVFYDFETMKIVYSEKFDGSNPTFRKPNGTFNEDGRVYLSWFSSGGGSGYTVSTYAVTLNRNGNIDFDHLYDFGELSYLLFNKNDQEIIMLSGYWGMEEDETHFSDHVYSVTHFSFTENRFISESFGLTKKKYSSGDEDLPPLELLKLIVRGESIFPVDFQADDYKAR